LASIAQITIVLEKMIAILSNKIGGLAEEDACNAIANALYFVMRTPVKERVEIAKAFLQQNYPEFLVPTIVSLQRLCKIDYPAKISALFQEYSDKHSKPKPMLHKSRHATFYHESEQVSDDRASTLENSKRQRLER